MNRRIGLACVLAATQLLIAASILSWSRGAGWTFVDSKRPPGRDLASDLLAVQSRDILRGINAPIFLLSPPYDSVAPRWGFSAWEALYLLAVAALWFCVGLILKQLAKQNSGGGRNSYIKWLVTPLALASGVCLFGITILNVDTALPSLFHRLGPTRPDYIIELGLFFAWSLFLIATGICLLIASFRSAKFSNVAQNENLQ